MCNPVNVVCVLLLLVQGENLLAYAAMGVQYDYTEPEARVEDVFSQLVERGVCACNVDRQVTHIHTHYLMRFGLFTMNAFMTIVCD